MRAVRVGLALGSGAARGLAHIGVLEALVEAGIAPAAVAGTSMGSLVAALYARWLDPGRVREHLLGAFRNPAFTRILGSYWEGVRAARRSAGMRQRLGELKRALLRATVVARPSMVSRAQYAGLMQLLVGADEPLETTRIPCVAVAAGLRSWRERILVGGSTQRAVAASCSVPGIFPPIPDGDDELVDGGILLPVPVTPVRALGAEFVIAVDVGTEELTETAAIPTGLDIVLRSASISRDALARIELARANLVIAPDVTHLDWFDFHRAEEAIARGAEATRRAIEPWLGRLRARGGAPIDGPPGGRQAAAG
ncbi:MAG TPA: patatin-like phospholipase family protein [Thermodesulfobacteriota bacterium]